jgi:hypothetical protein
MIKCNPFTLSERLFRKRFIGKFFPSEGCGITCCKFLQGPLEILRVRQNPCYSPLDAPMLLQ